MHRRTLILRRFGDLSFGLGYDLDGTWVDHASIETHGAVPASPAEQAALDAIHVWFDCCRDGVVAIPLAPETDDADARAASSSLA